MLFAIYTFMKIVVPEWQGRISPVFDVANKILLVDIEDHRELQRQQGALVSAAPWARADTLRRMGAEVLICGAVSRPMETALRTAGINVIHNICGPVEEVLEAYCNGHLDENVFMMPGCCGRRRQFRGGKGGRGGGCQGRSWS